MRHWNNGTDHRHSKSCYDKSSPARRTINISITRNKDTFKILTIESYPTMACLNGWWGHLMILNIAFWHDIHLSKFLLCGYCMLVTSHEWHGFHITGNSTVYSKSCTDWPHKNFFGHAILTNGGGRKAFSCHDTINEGPYHNAQRYFRWHAPMRVLQLLTVIFPFYL